MKVLLSSTVLVIFSLIHISAQVKAFLYQPDKVRVGEVFFYKKSNQDGSNPHWVATYISGPNQLESLKWSDGRQGATLVEAEMDWSTFSVKKFIGGRISPNGEREVGGQLDLLDTKGHYRVQFGEVTDTMQITAFPWHSYDFDFASLNLTWPHLRKFKSNFTINIADVEDLAGRPKFVNKGSLDIKYQKEENRNGENCYKYSIDGPGLEHRGGTIWFSKSGHFIEYLIDLPDEAGYIDMKFSLDRIETMDAKQWEAFKLNIAKGK